LCRSELNLGVQPAGFTVAKSFRPTDDHKDYLRVRYQLQHLLMHTHKDYLRVPASTFINTQTHKDYLRVPASTFINAHTQGLSQGTSFNIY